MKWLKLRLKDFFRYRELLFQLVSRDIKIKYRRSFLGYLWSVLNPLLIMTVMSIVFSQLFRWEIENYAAYLLTGQVMFSFMTEATTMSIGSIFTNAALVKKTYVPKYIFCVSKVTSSLVNLLCSLCALWIVMLVTGVGISPWFLFFPVVVLELYVFSMGMGLFLAQAAVFFRDIQYIYGVITTAWMYLTPIFYPESLLIEKKFDFVLNWNPMYYYIAQFRDAVLYGQAPESGMVLGGIGFALFFLVLGVWSFVRSQDKFILYI